MNKTEIIEKLAESSKLRKKEIAELVDEMIEIMSASLERDEEVKLIGFGTLKPKERKSRNGVNPKNPKEKIIIPAQKSVSFVIGKPLKEKLNKK